MFRRQSRWSLLLLVIASVSCAHAQAPSAACPQDENSIRALLRDINATREHGGVTALAKYYADVVISTDGGERISKAEYLSELNKQGAGNNTTSGGEPEEVFVTFTHGVAILSYIDKMQNSDLSTGVQYHGTFRESRIFACENGIWKIIFRSEIPRPNMTRVPVESVVQGMGLRTSCKVRFARGPARNRRWCAVEHRQIDWAARSSWRRSSK